MSNTNPENPSEKKPSNPASSGKTTPKKTTGTKKEVTTGKTSAAKQKPAVKKPATPKKTTAPAKSTVPKEKEVEGSEELVVPVETVPTAISTKTSPIHVEQAINTARTVTYPEEFAQEDKKNPWPRRILIILGFVIVFAGALAVGIFAKDALIPQQVDTNTGITIPTPTATEGVGPSTELDLTQTEAQWMVVTGSVENTMALFAEQLGEQFGQEIIETIKLSSETSEYDERGVQAPTAMASISPIPANFDVEASLNWFRNNVTSLGSTWEFTEDSESVEGVTELRRIRLFDAAEKPEIPLVLDIAYFKIDGEDTLTISVVASIYAE